MQNKEGLIKPTIYITGLSIGGIIINFFTQLVIAYYFGAKFERDAYFVAITIPTYISAIFIGSFGIVFLPKFIEILNSGVEKSSEFLNSIFLFLIVILLIIATIFIIFPKTILHYIASGFTDSQICFTSKILVILAPTFILNIFSNILSSIYQIYHKFFRPAFAPIVTSVISLIFTLIFSQKIGIFSLAYGYLAGSILSFIYLIPIILKFKISFNFKFAVLKPFILKILPLLLTGIIFRSTSLFERLIASNLEAGSISYLGYTSQILTILGALTTSGIAVSVYPLLSKLWTNNQFDEFRDFMAKVIKLIIQISLPISFAIIFFGDSAIKLVYERGAFTNSATLAVYKALLWSLGAYFFQNLGSVIVKIFYIS
jgi:putative peptidoglycan lipid II flippase